MVWVLTGATTVLPTRKQISISRRLVSVLARTPNTSSPSSKVWMWNLLKIAFWVKYYELYQLLVRKATQNNSCHNCPVFFHFNKTEVFSIKLTNLTCHAKEREIQRKRWDKWQINDRSSCCYSWCEHPTLIPYPLGNWWPEPENGTLEEEMNRSWKPLFSGSMLNFQGCIQSNETLWILYLRRVSNRVSIHRYPVHSCQLLTPPASCSFARDFSWGKMAIFCSWMLIIKHQPDTGGIHTMDVGIHRVRFQWGNYSFVTPQRCLYPGFPAASSPSLDNPYASKKRQHDASSFKGFLCLVSSK